MKNLFENFFLKFIPIKLIAEKFNPILLYHSLGSYTKFSKNIDHVDLETLDIQLRSIQKYWKFVQIDEFIDAKNKRGLASLTIDDGYKNVVDEALIVFKNLNIPVTIFINSSTLDGKIFWRDKVRFLIENNLLLKYIDHSKIFDYSHIKNFYSVSKSEKVNSILVENDINEFFKKEKINLNNNNRLCFDNKNYFIKDDFVFYGNHTANHYMLSSLNKSEQYEEIIKCKNLIDSLDVKKSEVFSIPFGGDNSFNQDTICNLKSLNYKKILKSTNNLEMSKNSYELNRFMPKSYTIEKSLKRLFIKSIIKRK